MLNIEDLDCYYSGGAQSRNKILNFLRFRFGNNDLSPERKRWNLIIHNRRNRNCRKFSVSYLSSLNTPSKRRRL